MKILIYGGSFDPVHKGHYALLKAACKQIKPDITHIFTAYQSPYKEKSPVPFAVRQKMAQDALADIWPNIIFDDFELKAKRVTYTYETVKHVRKLHPKAKIYLLVGTDCLNTMHKWQNAQYTFKNATIVAGKRKGFTFETKDFDFILLEGRFPLISSSQIRLALMCNGLLPNSILPQTAKEIEDKQMYGLYLHKWLQQNLRPNRYLHVKLVAQAAVNLAQTYKINAEKLAIAGILHDMAKCMPNAELVKYAVKNKLKVEDFKDIAAYSPSLLHADVSAHMAQAMFNIKDKDILNAIKHHTLGAPNMSEVEKVLFIADMASKDRRYKDAQQVQSAALKSLDDGLLAAMAIKLSFTVETRKWLAPRGIKLWNDLTSKNK